MKKYNGNILKYQNIYVTATRLLVHSLYFCIVQPSGDRSCDFKKYVFATIVQLLVYI